MTTDEYLRIYPEKLQGLSSRLSTLNLTDEELNCRPDGWHWTLGQIADHIYRSHQPDLDAMRLAIQKSAGASVEEFQLTWLGKIVVKGAGPESNANVPNKKMLPADGHFGQEIVQLVLTQIQETEELAKLAQGKPINRLKVRNPFFPLMRMSLSDYFALLLAHLERHIGQIERFAIASRENLSS